MSGKPILFISDLHLEEDRADITRMFSGFLDTHASKAQALYILGDFFNVWLGDDHNSPLHQQVASELLALAENGVDIYLMHGNRDFLLGDAYAARCGASLIYEPYLLEAFGTKLLLMHGDILCTKDTDYLAFRKQVRDPEWQQGFLARPIAERIAFAEEARKKSKAMSSNKAEDIMDVSQEAVLATLQQHQLSTLLHGHTHRPDVHSFKLANKKAQRYVLGDWDRQAWFIQLDAQGLELRTI